MVKDKYIYLGRLTVPEYLHFDIKHIKTRYT